MSYPTTTPRTLLYPRAARPAQSLGRAGPVHRPRVNAAGHSRERNLHDAGQLAAHHGLTGLTVEEVAHDAGVSRLTVYHHFDSPGRLLEALGWSVLERADIGRVRQGGAGVRADLALARGGG